MNGYILVGLTEAPYGSILKYTKTWLDLMGAILADALKGRHTQNRVLLVQPLRVGHQWHQLLAAS